MMLYIESEVEPGITSEEEKLLRLLAEAAWNMEGSGAEEPEVSLTLTDDEGIAEINAQYRNIDAPTDVLSFPMYEPGEIPANTDQELLLGDIVISIPRMEAQAAEYGHSRVRELCFLFVHGMLHLLGHDHEDENQRLLMEKKQDEILALYNIER